MPMLRPEDRAQLLVEVERCQLCDQMQRRGYCRQCDVFYLYGCACTSRHGHEQHRTYENFTPSELHP